MLYAFSTNKPTFGLAVSIFCTPFIGPYIIVMYCYNFVSSGGR